MLGINLKPTITMGNFPRVAYGFSVLTGLCLLPFAVWLSGLDIEYYRLYPAPPGQYWYLASKLFGLVAIWLFVVQVMTGLLRYVPLCQSYLARWPHRMVGPLSVLLMCAHFSCFAMGVATRKESSALHLFVPNFSDFYHGAIAVGILAAGLTFMAAVSRAWSRLSKLLHNFMLPASLLAIVHSYAIGTETRQGLFHYAHIALLLIVLAAVISAWRWGWRPWR